MFYTLNYVNPFKAGLFDGFKSKKDRTLNVSRLPGLLWTHFFNAINNCTQNI